MTRSTDASLLPLIVAAFVLACPRIAAGQDGIDPASCADPRGCIETLHRGLVELSREGGAEDLEHRYARVEPLISATHDLPYIARIAVRRHWSDFPPEQQEAFVRAFARLSVMTYASRFVALSEDTFRVVAVNESGADRAQVVASISRDAAPDIPIEYLLQRGQDGWRIVNVIADGVSDLALRRAEYQRILEASSVADLIAELERQTQALQASAATLSP